MKNCLCILLLNIITLSKLVGQVPVTWKDLVGVSVSGNTITKNSTIGWSSGATSNEVIPANTDGYVEYIVPNTIYLVMVGLSEANQSVGYESINYASYLAGTGYFAEHILTVYESGENKPITLTGYSQGNTIRVGREGNKIVYRINNQIFREVNVSTSPALFADISIFSPGASLNNVIINYTGMGQSLPAQPTGVSASATSSSSINVFWTASSGATSYQIDRATNSSFTTGLVQNTPTSNSYAASGLTASTTYYFRVRAVNANGSSTPSATVYSTTQAAPGGGIAGQWNLSGSSVYYPTSGTVHIGKNNVSIGSETGYSLFVANGIKTEKYKLEVASTSGWADYVFNKNYKLLPLNQLKSFIDKNKHLPNFPSTKKILADGGYEMGDMMKRQQEAIEHLHLYIIDMKEEIIKVKNQNINLEKEIDNLRKLIKN